MSQFPALRLYSEVFADTQHARLIFANRVRSGSVDPAFYAYHLKLLTLTEKSAAKVMRAEFKRCAPGLYAWAQETRGLAPHTLARLVGVIGHPRVATPHHWEGEGADRVLVADEPFERNVAKLWAYCGVGDPNRKRRAGMTAADATRLGNPRAKALCHIIAGCQLKTAGAYADEYYTAKTRYEQSRPEWTLLHRHNAALRRVKKAFLLDLWRVAA